MRGVFVDIETNGLDFYKHVPLDVAFSIVDLNDFTVLASYSSLLQIYSIDWANSDEEALKINGFNINTHVHAKDPLIVGLEIESLFNDYEIEQGKAVFICQNPSFDRVFFGKIVNLNAKKNKNLPYHWLDLASMYWARFYGCCWPVPQNLSLSKDAIAKSFDLPVELKPHTALGGVAHLISCYKEVTRSHPRSQAIEMGMTIR